jgi:CBS domain-containing protein
MNKKLLEKVTITMPASLKDVVIKLNNSGLKIICVVDKNDKLIGTISDGDIRRSLLKNTSLNQSIEKVVNKNPILINEERDFLKVDKIFNKYKISAIPVVDKKNVLKDLITSFDSESLNNIIYIIAGGRGKRMMPLTRENPKPLLNYMG